MQGLHTAKNSLVYDNIRVKAFYVAFISFYRQGLSKSTFRGLVYTKIKRPPNMEDAAIGMVPAKV